MKYFLSLNSIGSIVARYETFAHFKSKSELTQIQGEFMQLGFFLNEKSLQYVATLNPKDLEELFQAVAKMSGADKEWNPFYPGFPNQVKELDNWEIFYNAICHYWTFGKWEPVKVNNDSKTYPSFEKTTFREINVITKTEWLEHVKKIVSSNGALDLLSKEIIEDSFENLTQAEIEQIAPEKIPFKETMALFVTQCYKKRYLDIAKKFCKTATDVLRVATVISGGKADLSENVKFRLKTSEKKFLFQILKNMASANLEEDVSLYGEEWKRLFTCMAGVLKVSNITTVARKHYAKKTRSEESKFKSALANGNLKDIFKMSPGRFARRLNYLIEKSPEPLKRAVIDSFLSVADKVDSKVLYQLYGYFLERDSQSPRIIQPINKKAVSIKKSLPMDPDLKLRIVQGLNEVLNKRYSGSLDLGKVWIDPRLKKIPIPLQMRDVDPNFQLLARGARFPLGDQEKPIIRFFDHWERSSSGNLGITDLHVYSFKGNDFKEIEKHVCWANLKAPHITHSGDQLKLDNGGCCQFVDVDLENVDADYILMEMKVFSGGNFKEQKTFAGWMMRSREGSEEGKIFDPRFVENAFSITRCQRNCMVALIDVKAKEFIWAEVEGLLGKNSKVMFKRDVAYAKTEDYIKKYLNSSEPSLYTLFLNHSKEVVESPEEADTVFGLEWATKHTEVLSNFLK